LDSGRLKEACIRWGCTQAPPGEYHGTIHARLRVVKVLWPLLIIMKTTYVKMEIIEKSHFLSTVTVAVDAMEKYEMQ